MENIEKVFEGMYNLYCGGPKNYASSSRGLIDGDLGTYLHKMLKHCVNKNYDKVASYMTIYFSFHEFTKSELEVAKKGMHIFSPIVNILKANGYKLKLRRTESGKYNYGQLVIYRPDGKMYESNFPYGREIFENWDD